MKEQNTLIQRLEAGDMDGSLSGLYGGAFLGEARGRCLRLAREFERGFGHQPDAFFSAPGRTELGGNHTDHQHGRVLAAAVNLDILAAASPNGSGRIRLLSEGYPLLEVSLDELSIRPEEKNTSAALIRGVAARFSELGCPLSGAGLDACLVSSVPGGSGLSSSAAFEVLVGVMLNEFFADGRFSPVELAKIGQYAENVYFGKPSGLMDQTASSVGGVVTIDFKDPASPVVEQVPLDLAAEGYALCILDSGAGHHDLTGEYAAITREMGEVSRCFGKEYLREVDEGAFLWELPRVRETAGDRATLRALHFLAENRRVGEQVRALRQGDFGGFLRLVRESGRSSALYLQNIIPTGETARQELMLTLALCERLLLGKGAVRVHGGGFGGTAQAFVPLDMLSGFQAGTEAVLGAGSCHVLSVRSAGGVRL